MQTKILLLDLENLQPDDLWAPVVGSCKIKVFLGAHQTKIPVAVASALQAFGPDAEYIQMEGSGHNALDFHIAYYLGRLAVEHSKARFQSISNDAGFDPLVAHLRAKNLHCERMPTLAGSCLATATGVEPAADRIAAVIADLIKRQAERPQTLKTLGSTIHALFRKQLSETELREMLEALIQRGVVKVTDGKLAYELPKEA